MNAEHFWRRIFAAVEWPSKKLGEAFPDWAPSAPPRSDREAWLTVISDLTTALTEERSDNANLRQALEARAEDTFRLDWLAEQALRTPTAIEFEYTSVPAAPWRGYRVSGRDFIGPRMPTLRQAIDAALAESGI